MASSHKTTPRDYVIFMKQYLFLSVILTIVLLIYSYWDVIQLRYFSGFFGSAQVSEQYQELFIVGFGNNLSSSFSEFLPVIITFFLASVVAYTLYNAYTHTYYDSNVNKNYVNLRKKHSLAHISLHYIVVYSAAFVVPLLFWCFYLISWFPAMAKVPLGYILNESTLVFAGITLLMFILMVMLTHIGIIITRFTLRLFRIA